MRCFMWEYVWVMQATDCVRWCSGKVTLQHSACLAQCVAGAESQHAAADIPIEGWTMYRRKD